MENKSIPSGSSPPPTANSPSSLTSSTSSSLSSESGECTETPSVDALSSLARKAFSILLWHEPIVSAIFFSCALLFTFLVEFYDYGAITLLSYIALLNLLVCFVFVNANRILNAFRYSAPAPTSSSTISPNNSSDNDFAEFSNERELVSKETAEKYLPQILYIANRIHCYFLDTLQCRSNLRTLSFMILFLILSLLGRIFSAAALFGITSVLLFTIPRIYLSNKQKIDPTWKAIQTKVQALAQIITITIPLKQRNSSTASSIESQKKRE